jgi:hypothetical protein
MRHRLPCTTRPAPKTPDRSRSIGCRHRGHCPRINGALLDNVRPASPSLQA